MSTKENIKVNQKYSIDSEFNEKIQLNLTILTPILMKEQITP